MAALVEEAKQEGGSLAGSSSGGNTERSVELAVSLVARMLRLQRSERPSMKEVLDDPFFSEGSNGGGGGDGGESKADSAVGGCGGSGGGGGLVDENECVVCMEVERSHMFSPCNHFCVCKACADLIMASPTAECPKCRTKADRVGRIYV